MIDAPLHQAVQALLREVSDQAILPYYRKLSEQQILAKSSDDDVVTIADHAAEEMLAAGLRRIIDLPIVGEEAAYGDPRVMERLSGDCWIVDPIDGTRNFAAGKPPFGILIAMAAWGSAHSGWIYDVLTGRLCLAQRGKGAFVDGEQITARSTGKTPPVAAISLIFMDDAKRKAVKNAIAPSYELVDIPYCAAEQYPRLALGTNDVSIFERTLPWDHAAGVLWLNEAGGRAARPDGSEYRVDEGERRGLIGAASRALWDQLAARMIDL